MIDKKWIRFLCLIVSAVLFIISLGLSVRADSFYNDDGFFTVTSSDYDDYPDLDYRHFLDSPIIGGNHTIPSDYSIIAKGCYIYPNQNYQLVYWVYNRASTAPFPIQLSVNNGSSYLYKSSGSGDFIVITDRVFSDGSSDYWNYTTSNTANISGICSFYVPLVNRSTDVPILPESQISFVLNTAIVNKNLQFNCVINSGDSSSVKYYLFPSIAPISGGSTSFVIPETPVNQLTVEQQLTFFDKGFKVVGELIEKIGNYIEDIGVPSVSLSVTSSSRSSSLFNPDSYNVSYEYLGNSRLYPLGDTLISTSGSLSIPDILGRNTGVFSYQQLKLVAVVDVENRSFISVFDFNPGAINNGAPVAPQSLIPSADYPTFPNAQSPYKELADYIKNLYETDNLNDKRNNNNLLAMLNSMPWANFVGTGFVNALPNLSFTLDSLFDSLFDKFTAPTEEQIDEIYAEVQSERSDLRSKLAFVDDVKTEYYFVISTITADNNSVPPDFEFSLPSIWSGGQNIRVKLISYEIATPETMANIKQVLTVFLSLALLLHIWRTLPSTVGNMPRGDV